MQYIFTYRRKVRANLNSNFYIPKVEKIAWDVTLQERDNEKNE